MAKLFFFLLLFSSLYADIKLGVDVLFEEKRCLLKGKKIGLLTNHTAVNQDLITTVELFQKEAKEFSLVAIFAPEHGLFGDLYAEKMVQDSEHNGIPVFSLHGKTKRPTAEMLKGIDTLVFDIQDIGSRSYTYTSTLFYCMEEAAKKKISVIVLDRPNPLGDIVDGPLVEEKWRSFLGYINVPYCHGMTVCELARFFNSEYHVNADLKVIPMKGWKRKMTFQETHLTWIPTSPQIPEGDTPFFYPTTGLIGHLSLANMGVGYTLPFKIVGAPWMHGKRMAEKLNALHLPGVLFHPFSFRPFFGKFKNENCQGIKIHITDEKKFLPFTTQYALIGMIKTLYPKQFKEAIELSQKEGKMAVFNKLNGSEEILTILTEENFFIWQLREKFQKVREEFLGTRKKYLFEEYE